MCYEKPADTRQREEKRREQQLVAPPGTSLQYREMESGRIFSEAEVTTHDLTITEINRDICRRLLRAYKSSPTLAQYCRSSHYIMRDVISRLLHIYGNGALQPH